MTEIFAAVYGKASCLRNAESAFRQTGIHPFNPSIFTDDDFLCADVTDIFHNEEASATDGL